MTGTPPPGAPGEPDALESLRHWRLRPSVTASPLGAGLHLRGWSTSVTLEGSPALPALWRMVEEALRTGGAADLAARTGTGTPLRGALCTLIGQLHAHGMLVEDRAPAMGTPAADWLLSVAEHPAGAAAALAATRVEVRAAGREGALAPAVVRALVRAGVTAVAVRADGGPGERVLLRAAGADGTERAVGAAVRPGGAFVTPVGSPARAEADTAALADRLGRDGAAGPGAEPDPALAALVAGAAAQRLLCALAGLPDPGLDPGRDPGQDGAGDASDAGDPGALPVFPTVLVAGDRPLTAAYHPWPRGAAAPAAAPGTLAEALAGVAALGDERLGVLTPPLTGSLPQLPVALAGCAAPGGGLLTAGAVRADLARLDALCRAAELSCGAEGAARRAGPVVVGAGPGHALGRALRRAALRLPPPSAGPAPRSGYMGGHPQARHWWGVLTRRLGVRAELGVTPLDAAGTAYRAEVRGGAVPGRLLGRAVEATAGDAAAFAALAALVRVRARQLDPTVRHITSPGGESAPLAAAGTVPAPWEDESWTAGWWAALATREAALHATLLELTGLRTAPWEPPDPGARGVFAALRGCGFTVLTDLTPHDRDTEGGPR
ncbi:hypothetical protein ACGFXC_05820 [Streptomyces sp. NPDC048507]|uniref:hypothetical protein n=1 Tax=Streptomyces sp. NPDC048507 TaxID=3365560 RepID=UPI003713819B